MMDTLPFKKLPKGFSPKSKRVFINQIKTLGAYDVDNVLVFFFFSL